MHVDMTQLGLLLFVSALVAMLMRRLHLPYTVGLVAAGMVLVLMQVRVQMQLSKDLIFSVFLPPLVFEAALCIRWSQLKSDLVIVSTLATAGVAIAAVIVAAGMHWLLEWPWGSAAVFGILISATDPVSVIATFKEAGLHGRLRLLVEAESLLNDGTAAVAFVIALQMATQSMAHTNMALALLLTVGGGIVCGLAVGAGFMLLAGRTNDHLVEITLTTLSAYTSFLLAEHFHFSGVLATLCAGLLTGNYGRMASLSSAARDAVDSFWEYIAFVANSLVFLLIGVHETQQHFLTMWSAILLTIMLVLISRAAAIYPLCAVFNRSRMHVDIHHQHVLFWGGLRGALALALVLGLPPDMPRREDIVTIAFAVVAFSVFVQGLTMSPLLRRLGQLDIRPRGTTQ
ncbi:MAG: sodium:proton antiporter [Steroidobacter sp.]